MATLGRSRRTDRRCRSADRRAVLVSFRAWPTGGRGRSSGRSGLRPGTRFRSASSRTTLRDELSARAGRFFKPLDDPLVLSRMTRPGADVREAKLLQELSDIARMKVDAEPFGNDTLEFDSPAPADAIFLTARAGLNDLRKLSQLFLRQAWLGTLRPVVDEALRPRNVEAMNPVAPRLAIHAANLRRRRPVHSIANRRQRQKTTALAVVLRSASERAKLFRRIVFSQSHR